jgi:heptosyltransferase-2
MVSFYAALAHAPAPNAPAPADLPRPTLNVTQAQLTAASTRLGLQPGARLIAFAPGAEFGPAKRWPVEHFAELAAIIRKNDSDAKIVMLGSPKDKEICDKIADARPWLLNLAGVTTLGEAIAILARADVVISNDSGLMNIASALNRPVIGIYGPTDWKNTPPFSDVAKIVSLQLDCSPCQQRVCPLGHHHCMRNLTADIVWTHLQKILSRLV